MIWPWQFVITKAQALDAKSVLSIQTRTFAMMTNLSTKTSLKSGFWNTYPFNKNDFRHPQKFKAGSKILPLFLSHEMRQASKTCPHQMSAPQFSRKIQNAFNGSKTPIHINKNFSQVVRNFRYQRTNREICEKTAKSKNTL